MAPLKRKFESKIIDFGFACPLAGKDGNGLLEGRMGSLPYMAFEIRNGTPYRGEPVDIFALGHILWIMKTKSMLFGRATPSDESFTTLVKKPEKFFKMHNA